MVGQVIADPSLGLLSLCGVVPQVPILVMRALERRSKLESEVGRGDGGWGWCSPYIGARGAPGRGGNGW
jgi:hypothetical protein